MKQGRPMTMKQGRRSELEKRHLTRFSYSQISSLLPLEPT